MNDFPIVIEGIKCYAPEIAKENKDFNKSSFEQLFKSEENNFWFKSRNKVIQTLVSKYYGIKNEGKFLEIGCGTGFVLKGLKIFKQLELIGADIHLEGLKYAKMRLPDIEFVQLDAINIPFHNEFDCIGAFDVLEHITQDELVIQNIYKSLKNNGYFFISVPQYKFMWSYLDDISCHKRRYTKSNIKDKLTKSGFKTVYTSSFVFTLFPLMYMSRLLKRNQIIKKISNNNSLNELQINSLINFVFSLLMKIDECLIKLNLKLPYGGSLMLVAKK
jgi:SAM-dependent methyltransferase